MSEKTRTGILEIMPEGHGFLRDLNDNFRANGETAYVSSKLIRQYKLRQGVEITGEVGKPKRPKQSPPLNSITRVFDMKPQEYGGVEDIKDRTSIDPEDPLIMDQGPKDRIGKLMDLVTPMGKGQRGMIISPPKAGKTTILKHIAKSVLKKYPDIHVYVLLIDERPEEVTDFKRALNGVPVFHSSSDRDTDEHLRIASLTMNMAARRCEVGQDVLVLIDSLTRMGRAFNKDTNSGGKTLSGGLAAGALELPRRFFGSARNIEDGGSLTIMATILVETNSRMDEVIFQEFKGTGNLDLVLSRECAERRLFPAINIRESGTRKEEKVLDEARLNAVNLMRRRTAGMKAPEALQHVMENLRALTER